MTMNFLLLISLGAHCAALKMQLVQEYKSLISGDPPVELKTKQNTTQNDQELESDVESMHATEEKKMCKQTWTCAQVPQYAIKECCERCWNDPFLGALKFYKQCYMKWKGSVKANGGRQRIPDPLGVLGGATVADIIVPEPPTPPPPTYSCEPLGRLYNSGSPTIIMFVPGADADYSADHCRAACSASQPIAGDCNGSGSSCSGGTGGAGGIFVEGSYTRGDNFQCNAYTYYSENWGAGQRHRCRLVHFRANQITGYRPRQNFQNAVSCYCTSPTGNCH